MPIRITEIENSNLKDGTQESPSDAGRSSTNLARVFKVEGTLYSKDAELLEGICRQVFTRTGYPVLIDLNDVCFLNKDSAAVICRMKRENVIAIEGLNLFIKKLMELVDVSDSSGETKCS